MSPRWRQAFITAGAPILALLLFVCVGAFAAFIHFAQQQDRAYVESSRKLAASALNGRLRGLSDLTLDFASWNEAYDAISVRWRPAWVAANFYSSVTDGLIVFRADGSIRYAWLPDELNGEQATLPRTIVGAARTMPNLQALPRAAHQSGIVTRALVRLNGRLALLSVAAVTPEDDGVRLRRIKERPVDYLAVIDILEPAQIAALSDELDLRGLMFSPQAHAPAGWVSLELRDARGGLLGCLHWRDAHPGSAAFSREIGPVFIGLLMAGALAIYFAARMMRREISNAARVESALESSRLKSEFFSNMSLELRTPLDAILGYAELIEEEAPSETAFNGVRSDAASISRAAGQLRRLVDDLLDHSRIDAGRLQLAPEPIKLSELLAEIDDLLAPAARAQGDKLVFTCDDPDFTFSHDHQRVRQCLFNLVEDSIKFTQNGAVSVSAAVNVEGASKGVVFTIADYGAAVPPELQGFLFEPFALCGQNGAMQKRGGALSLSIARKLARVMGGDVTYVRSAAGENQFVFSVSSAAPRLYVVAA